MSHSATQAFQLSEDMTENNAGMLSKKIATTNLHVCDMARESLNFWRRCAETWEKVTSTDAVQYLLLYTFFKVGCCL